MVPGDINTLTGGYRYDKHIIEGLHQYGWTVELVTLSGDYPFPTDQQRTLAGEILSGLPDKATVIIDGLAYSTLPAQIRPHHQRLKIIALIHHPLALETGLDAQQSAFLKTQETQALQLAHRVITTSASTKASLSEYAVPASQITTIRPGTHAAQLAQGSGTDLINLLCVATLTARKGHSVLLNALSDHQDKHWHLYCVGSTERDPQISAGLFRLRDKLQLQHRVTFTGELDDTHLRRYYQQSDLFVLASYHEGYGMVLDEAIAYGLPIVATNAGAMADTIPTGAALLVTPGNSPALGDALASFMTNTTLRTQLRSQACAARSIRRSWEQASAEYAEFLKNV